MEFLKWYLAGIIVVIVFLLSVFVGPEHSMSDFKRGLKLVVHYK